MIRFGSNNKIKLAMGIRIGIGLRIGGRKAGLWNPEKHMDDIAFLSGNFSGEKWLDTSGNDNDLLVYSGFPDYNGAWGDETVNWKSAYGFSVYAEFIHFTGVYNAIFSLGHTTGSDQFLYVGVITDVLRVFNRGSNQGYSGSTTLTNGQKYRVLINFIDKDNINVYLDGSAVIETSATNRNWTWNANWNRIGLGMYRNGASTYVYNSTGARTLHCRVMTGTSVWADIDTNIEAKYNFNNFGFLTDLTGNARNAYIIGTQSTTKTYVNYANVHQTNGYSIFKRAGYVDVLTPYTDAKTKSVTTVTNYTLFGEVAGSDSVYNGCDLKIAFPYNAMTADSNTALGGGILFTGTTPNQLDIRDVWDDHLEKHVLFYDKGITDVVRSHYVQFFANFLDQDRLSASKMILFKAVQDEHVNILKDYLGYDTTPAAVTSATYRMIYANDSFRLSATHLEAVKFAGQKNLFYCEYENEWLKTRFMDVEKICHRNIFCNGSVLWVYKKPLLPSHLATALNTHLGLSDIEHLITTAGGVDYYNLNYERYSLSTTGTLNLNPTASANTKYDIFDRRNVVGSAKEIWHGDMVLGSAFWTWNVTAGTKKLFQPSVNKYIQAAYSGKLFIRQDFDHRNNILVPYIISFGTPLTGATKTAMFGFIDFPETINEPAIVGDGVTDDTLAINTAMGSNAAVMLYEKTAKIQTSVKIPSDVQLILADSSIILNNDINLNVVNNNDFGGDENVRLTGYGTSVIDGNGANQDRDAYLPDTVQHHFYGMLFANIVNLRISGLEIKDTAMWGFHVNYSENCLIEHIRFNQLGSKPNQDGLSISFGTRHTISRYINGNTNDDLCPILNYDYADYNVMGISRRQEWLYCRDINHDKRILTGSRGGQTIRIYDNQGFGISNVEVQNLYHYRPADSSFSLSLIIFSDIDIGHRSPIGTNYNFTFKNIHGSATRNIRFHQGNYQDILIDKIVLDDPVPNSEKHILITGSTLTNVLIESILDYAPGQIYDYQTGTLINFVHNEIINY